MKLKKIISNFFTRPNPELFYKTGTAPINLAIYSTYCGPDKSISFNPTTYSKYPSYFFSNNPKALNRAQKFGWCPVHLNQFEISSDRVVSSTQAKFLKSSPHRLPELQQYDYLLYLDDKLLIDEEKIESLVATLNQNRAAVALPRHDFLPPNVLFELTEAMFQKRYVKQREKMIQHIMQQLQSGARLDSTLYITGIILRNTRHPDIEKINELWFEGIKQCGIECQISFFFVAQKFSSILALKLQFII